MFPSSTFYNRSIFLIIRGLMSAIPLDSDPIFCRDTIICAAAADEDDDNKLESTADITDRDRSEDASEHRQTERKRAEGI